MDLTPKTDFDTILEKILEIGSVERVRVSSVYPDTITEKFLFMLKNNAKLMPHLHVSVQALDDKILSLMKRKYSAGYVVDILQKVQREVPGVSLTADIITGFPQEEEENFNNTLMNLEKIGFADLHVFPYSDREKTAALKLEGKVPPSLKKKRVGIIEKLNKEKFNDFRVKMINSEQRVYIEEIDENKAFGYTENYVKVFLPLKNEREEFLNIQVGEIVETVIKDFDGKLLEGRCLKER